MRYKLNRNDLENIDKVNDSSKLFSILINIMKKLRSKDGCMWDREQSHDSIKRNLIEETYEAVECIESSDLEGLKEELGDLMLQIIFHSQMASENGGFNINDVMKNIIEKLIRRHPHVFKNKILNSCDEILGNWEDIKKAERKKSLKKKDSIFADIPKILPSLHYAYEIQNRASRLGFDWDEVKEVFKKIKEEINEINEELKRGKKDAVADEIGDTLFSIVNFSRHLGIDCEQCLKNTSKKFIQRFDFMEKYAKENNLDFKKMSLEEKDKLWEIAKKNL
ncbi:MAG: nucleoside triphosphate pyrophosphohydrolase [Actinobacteria bacterium]|nr:nucleoside triphosphate pyrophosphohydrolase [Actinomycetota bacterium]MBL7060370.1 nucleoside triphosphate pyrophosphohydrolase [Actinomycetota bacterium]